MKTSRSSLFLMEMIIAILFFSLASAVCIQLFVKSYTLRQDSVKLNQATMKAQSMAELFYAFNGDYYAITSSYDALDGFLCEHDSDAQVITSYYSDAWEPVAASESSTDAEYAVSMFISEDGVMQSGEIYVHDTGSNSEIYSLSVQCYVPERSLQ